MYTDFWLTNPADLMACLKISESKSNSFSGLIAFNALRFLKAISAEFHAVFCAVSYTHLDVYKRQLYDYMKLEV